MSCHSCLWILMATGAMPVPGAAQLPSSCERAGGTSAYPIETTPGYSHDRFGTEPDDVMIEFGAFVASFDSDDDDDGDGVGDLRVTPEWVAYEIKPFAQTANGTFSPPIGVPRPNPWYEHPALTFVFNQPGLTSSAIDDSYRGIGTVFNRGHLAMRTHGNRIGFRQGCNTHFFWNAVPQRAAFNQGIWLHLETLTGAWANKYGGVWIITGPIFDAANPRQPIGDAGEVPVAVPNALFKIVARNDPDSHIPLVLAFIYPQEHPDFGPAGCSPPYPHHQFLVTVAEIEAVTGLDFFDGLDLTAAEREAFENGRASGLWPVEARFFGRSC